MRDWVVALPDSRGAPLGCWGSLRVYDSARLLKVRPQQQRAAAAARRSSSAQQQQRAAAAARRRSSAPQQ